LTIDNSSLIDAFQSTPEPVIQPVPHYGSSANKQLWVVRGDLIHPQLSGNKWFKLKYNLLAAEHQQVPAILSFGGAWSNHIYALAAAGNALQLPTIGVIRGRWHKNLTPTLADAVDWGMKLVFVDKHEYRQRHSPQWVSQCLPDWWHQCFGASPKLDAARQTIAVGEQHGGNNDSALPPWQRLKIIPEGGGNTAGMKGVKEWAKSIYAAFSNPTTFVIPVGSGGTLAGFASVPSQHQLIGVPVLKAGNSIRQTIQELLYSAPSDATHTGWQLAHGYEWGGYGRYPQALKIFVAATEEATGIPLDPVYSAKAAYAFFDILYRDRITTSQVALVHTGGLQGTRSQEQV